MQETLLISMHFKSSAQEYVDQKPIPVCIGPNETIHVADHHHLLSGIELQDFKNLQVILKF